MCSLEKPGPNRWPIGGALGDGVAEPAKRGEIVGGAERQPVLEQVMQGHRERQHATNRPNAALVKGAGEEQGSGLHSSITGEIVEIERMGATRSQRAPRRQNRPPQAERHPVDGVEKFLGPGEHAPADCYRSRL